jgi:hypothetical protein
MTWQMWLMVVLILIFGFIFFKLLEMAGGKILESEGFVDVDNGRAELDFVKTHEGNGDGKHCRFAILSARWHGFPKCKTIHYNTTVINSAQN